MLQCWVINPPIFPKFNFFSIPKGPIYSTIKSIYLGPTLHTFHMSRHHQEWPFHTKLTSIFLYVPYRNSSTSFHKSYSDTPNLYFHLASKAKLKLPMSLIPSLPSWNGLQTLNQPTHAIFLSSLPQTHRNLACDFLMMLDTPHEALKNKKQNKYSAFITDLIRHVRPTI